MSKIFITAQYRYILSSINIVQHIHSVITILICCPFLHNYSTHVNHSQSHTIIYYHYSLRTASLMHWNCHSDILFLFYFIILHMSIPVCLMWFYSSVYHHPVFLDWIFITAQYHSKILSINIMNHIHSTITILIYYPFLSNQAFHVNHYLSNMTGHTHCHLPFMY